MPNPADRMVRRTPAELPAAWLELWEAARAVRSRAHCPYSHYAVGAALRAEDGRIFAAANVENASYGLTLCAERAAVGRAVAEGATRFSAVAIVTPGPRPAAPCGACRQVLREFAPVPESLAVLLAAEGDAEVWLTDLAALLPASFGPEFLPPG